MNDIVLRALEPADIDTIYQWENDLDNWKVGAAAAPFSRKQIHEYILSYRGDVFADKQLRLMISNTEGERLGCVDLFDCDWVNSRCGVGILVDKTFRQQGIGAQALEKMIQYSRERLGLHQLYCVIGGDNEPSRRLFQKVGFSISGRLRSWLRRGPHYQDAYFYQKLL